MTQRLAFAVLLLAAPSTAFAQARPTSSGTAFMVTEDKALTNNHVVNGCQRVTVRNAAGQVATATIFAVDPQRDLAILGLPKGVVKPLVFRENPAVVRGETVVTYGFPLSGVLSSGPTLTTGDVSALAGLRDNPLHLQISAPVQPGNSGGPLLDSHAHVVGVVVSKLNAMRISQLTGGDIPQNVNFAVKGTAALAFLRERGLQPATAESIGPEKRNYEVGEIANVSTLFVQCYGGSTVAAQAAPATPPPAAAVAAGPKAADDPRFRLVNRGQKSIGEVFVVPTGTLNYGPNRLPAALAPGAAIAFAPPRDGKCTYDVKVIFTDMRALERKAIDLCKVVELPVP
jgi:hypothetical protein